MTKPLRIALLVLTLCAACSVPDGGDMAQFRATLASLPAGAVKALRTRISQRIALAFLAKKPQNFEVLKTECRLQEPDGTWGEWTEAFREYDDEGPNGVNALSLLVEFFFDGINLEGETYLGIKTEQDNHLKYEEARRSKDTGKPTECRHVWTPGYAPDEVPQQMLGPDHVSDEDIIKDMKDLPFAPPGFAPGPAGAGELAPLLPLLCPLDVSWACPDAPGYPGAPGTSPTGGDNGG